MEQVTGERILKKSADFARKALVKFCYKQRTVLFVGRKIPSQGPTPVTKKTKLERASHFLEQVTGERILKKSADFARKALVKFCYKQRTVLFVGRKIPSQGPTPVTKKTKLERASHFLEQVTGVGPAEISLGS